MREARRGKGADAAQGSLLEFIGTGRWFLIHEDEVSFFTLGHTGPVPRTFELTTRSSDNFA